MSPRPLILPSDWGYETEVRFWVFFLDFTPFSKLAGSQTEHQFQQGAKTPWSFSSGGQKQRANYAAFKMMFIPIFCFTRVGGDKQPSEKEQATHLSAFHSVGSTFCSHSGEDQTNTQVIKINSDNNRGKTGWCGAWCHLPICCRSPGGANLSDSEHSSIALTKGARWWRPTHLVFWLDQWLTVRSMTCWGFNDSRLCAVRWDAALLWAAGVKESLSHPLHRWRNIQI